MFNSKKESLFGKKHKKTSDNSFLNKGFEKSAETRSGNYAKKYKTTGNEFLDQFGNLGSFREPRSFDEISKDMSTLWAIDPKLTVKFTLYIRMITRSTQFIDGSKTEQVQRGAGLRHESIMRMIWLHIFHKEAFWENINLFISVGSWKDIIQMLQYDLIYNGWENRQLDWNKFSDLILAGLENPNTSELVKKYLPQIKAKSKCTTVESQADTIIGKWLANGIVGSPSKTTNYKKYRLLKSKGTAHTWQKLISQKRFFEIDFDTVHGRALSQLVSSKFLENQGLTEKYEKWIESKPIAKFTGFPHELFQRYTIPTHWEASSLRPMKRYEIDTLNKQFYGLVETAKKNIDTSTSMIVARDTSGSMGATATGTNVPCGDIAKSLAMFLSYMLPEGRFARTWIEFSRGAELKRWKGSTPYEHWKNDDSHYALNTNFQAVIDLLCDIKSEGVDEREFPSGIICISDGEFDPSSLNSTNTDDARMKLYNAGFSESFVDNFKIVLWNLQSRFYGEGTGEKFETYGEVENVYYFSGYDASVMAFLTGIKGKEKAPRTAEELFYSAMDQEVLNYVSL